MSWMRKIFESLENDEYENIQFDLDPDDEGINEESFNQCSEYIQLIGKQFSEFHVLMDGDEDSFVEKFSHINFKIPTHL